MFDRLLLLAAAIAATKGREGGSSKRTSFRLVEAHTYRIRVRVHRCTIPITEGMVDAAREQLRALGIQQVKLRVIDGKTFVDAEYTPRETREVPAGIQHVELGPVSADFEWIYANEITVPGV